MPIEEKDKGGMAALHWAAANGHNAAVRMLVVKGLDN
jgi:ankyrin repeat protein